MSDIRVSVTGPAPFIVSVTGATGVSPVITNGQTFAVQLAGVGPTGPRGAAGQSGSQGDAGPVGPTGSASTVAGPTGPTGAVSTVPGPTGASVVGATGPAGTAGGVGATGPTGARGIDGAAGQSITGPAGTSGQPGSTGPTGARGVDGAAGQSITGPTGPAGQRGDSGLVGATGATGARGSDGAAGESVTGPTGASGSDGAVGATGARGDSITGPTGARGVDGGVGATGSTGATGARGSDGAVGPTGAASTVTGPTGVAGATGAAGVAGATGPQGPAASLNYPSIIDFPATGSASALYLAEDTSRLYQWESPVYVEVGVSGGGGSGGAATTSASDLTSGTLPDARLSSSVLLASALAARQHQTTAFIDVVDRSVINSAIPPVSNAAYWTFFTPVYTVTITQIAYACTTAAAGVTLCRYGLYTADASGNATLVARTASDTTIFNASNTVFTRTLDTTGGYPASYTLNAGTRYAVAICIAAANTGSVSGVSCPGVIAALSPRFQGVRTGANDILTSQGSGQYNGTVGQAYWARLS